MKGQIRVCPSGLPHKPPVGACPPVTWSPGNVVGGGGWGLGELTRGACWGFLPGLPAG